MKEIIENKICVKFVYINIYNIYYNYIIKFCAHFQIKKSLQIKICVKFVYIINYIRKFYAHFFLYVK